MLWVSLDDHTAQPPFRVGKLNQTRSTMRTAEMWRFVKAFENSDKSEELVRTLGIGNNLFCDESKKYFNFKGVDFEIGS